MDILLSFISVFLLLAPLTEAKNIPPGAQHKSGGYKRTGPNSQRYGGGSSAPLISYGRRNTYSAKLTRAILDLLESPVLKWAFVASTVFLVGYLIYYIAMTGGLGQEGRKKYKHEKKRKEMYDSLGTPTEATRASPLHVPRKTTNFWGMQKQDKLL